jgi:hypothetical protein
MPLFSAGTTFNDVRIPFPHVRITGLAARSTLENLRREHPTATPVIVSGDGNSLAMLFDGCGAGPACTQSVHRRHHATAAMKISRVVHNPG